jgi:hypothetical protein
MRPVEDCIQHSAHVSFGRVGGGYYSDNNLYFGSASTMTEMFAGLMHFSILNLTKET